MEKKGYIMSKRVAFLKHAPPRRKYQHMQFMMEFKASLRDNQQRGLTEGTREYMLLEIKRMMGGGTDAYHTWFNAVYAYRSNGDQKTYEKKIKNKYAYLRRRERERTTPPDTSGMSALDASKALSAFMKKNWQYIPEIPL